MINNISLNDVNISASQTLDRYHLNKLNISFNNNELVNLNNEEDNIEQWTVDKETALHIGWDLTIVPQIKNLFIQQAKQVCLNINRFRKKTFLSSYYRKIFF
jgi:poly(A) polymerase Pap1